MNNFIKSSLLSSILLLTLTGCPASEEIPVGFDPPEKTIGERLFQETRFAQFFAANADTDINTPLAAGDSVVDITATRTGSFPGPFQGLSMNCSACHLVDQQVGQDGGGIRTYADFARRSLIPARTDGQTLTPRNSPPLVNSTLEHQLAGFLHFDGEFATAEDLVRGTLTGRNFGWLATEKALAVAQVAKVIREDDGSNALASEFSGWSYAELFLGTNPRISPALRLPQALRMDVTTATDQQILDRVATLIKAYVDGLRFSQDANGEYNGSPYDVFLAKNGLPRKPNDGETDIAYSRRLLGLVNNLASPKFLTHSDGQFANHAQQFFFGQSELQGLKVFLKEPSAGQTSGVGNCIACHAAPNFTDFKFHNTGVTQKEFDQLHGAGAFAALSIPSLAARNAAPEAFLPPTEAHPNGTGKFLSIPAADQAENTDLGLWNVFANGDITDPQTGLNSLLCDQFTTQVTACTTTEILPLTIAYFKTPALRDLSHSAPYMHNGQFDELTDVVDHYRTISEMARSAAVRNPSLELSDIHLSTDDTEALANFLKALNEDYE